MDGSQEELYVRKASTLLSKGVISCVFVNEMEAPTLLGWEKGAMPVVNIVAAERAAEAILLRWPAVRIVVVTCCVGHVLHCRGLERPPSSPTSVRRPTAVPSVAAAVAAGMGCRRSSETDADTDDTVPPRRAPDEAGFRRKPAPFTCDLSAGCDPRLRRRRLLLQG